MSASISPVSPDIEVAMGVENGRVIWRFKDPVREIVFETQNALDFAAAMADFAYEAKGDLRPADGALKADLIERHRMTLTQRVAIILHTLRQNKKKTDGHVAQAIVDVCLKEIF